MPEKNHIQIMQVFVSNITELFTLRGISRKLNKDPSLIHRTMKPLIKKKLVTINKYKQLGLNYGQNHQELAYIEHLRSQEFLGRNNDLAMFVDDVIEKFPEDFFVFLLFGSAVTDKNPGDIDVLFIVDNIQKVNTAEKVLQNISGNYEQKFDITVISFESVYEMLAKRNKLNIMNEVLNKHLIMYGAETFYRLIKKGRT